jgi:hypothetical protein
MATISKLIKAVLDFGRMIPEQLLAQGNAIVKALTGNPNFTNLPIDLAVLKSMLDAYAASIIEARDGSRKAMTLRNTLGQEVIRMLRALALYVELNCKDDMNIFLSSGFTPRSNTRTPAQPLDQPKIMNVGQGIPGQLLVSIKRVRHANHYELRSGAVGAAGATPTTWMTQTVSTIKTAAPINGLTPGTTYAIQVRAYGKLGFTEWSDSSNRMCI